jgi:hypothetical protein
MIAGCHGRNALLTAAMGVTDILLPVSDRQLRDASEDLCPGEAAIERVLRLNPEIGDDALVAANGERSLS